MVIQAVKGDLEHIQSTAALHRYILQQDQTLYVQQIGSMNYINMTRIPPVLDGFLTHKQVYTM